MAAVREEGDRAVLDYTRELDTARADPRPLLVPAGSSTRRSSGCPWRWWRACRWRSPTSPSSRRRGWGRTSRSSSPRASASPCASCRWAPPRCTCRGACSLPEHRGYGCGHRPGSGSGGGRRVLPPRPRRADRSRDPRHLPPAGGGAGVPHGRRPGDRGAGPRDADGGAGGCDRGSRQPLRAGGQAPALRRGGDRLLRGSQRPAGGARRGRRSGSRGARHARPGRARERKLRGGDLSLAECPGRARGGARAAGRGEPRGGARGVRAGAEQRLPRGGGDRQRVRPRAPPAHRRRGGGARAAGALRRLPVRGRRRGHRVRGLRGGLQPHPAHRGRRALCLRTRSPPLPPADGGGEDGGGGGEAVRKLAAAGAPIARAEGFEWHARSMEARMGENQES